jgi:hypothetical protein
MEAPAEFGRTRALQHASARIVKRAARRRNRTTRAAPTSTPGFLTRPMRGR